jgi:general secretion pathway protein C
MVLQMITFKYHIITTISVVFFAFIVAFTANNLLRSAIMPSKAQPHGPSIAVGTSSAASMQKSTVDINAIINSGVFRLPSTDNAPTVEAAAQDSGELILLGTITGSTFSSALIKKRSEPDSKIFPLWSDVYGFKLVRIDNSKVYLKSGGQIKTLDMFVPQNAQGGNPNQRANPSQGTSADKVRKTLSRSEMQQKIQGDMDKMLQGLRAGPFVVNGKIEGFKLIMVKSDNFLYTIGARSGDVIKRINGHPIDSTEKLYKIWQTLAQETRVTVDVDREGKIVSFDYTFTD